MRGKWKLIRCSDSVEPNRPSDPMEGTRSSSQRALKSGIFSGMLLFCGAVLKCFSVSPVSEESIPLLLVQNE